MEALTTLPTGQYIFVGIAGSLMIMSSLYLVTQGYIMPFASVVVIGFIMWMTWTRMNVSKPPPPEESPSQFDVFRQMESADQTRENPWVGFLQEDVYANRTGPIGTFVGNDDNAARAPLYAFT